MDSFQHTLDYDTKTNNQLDNENNIEDRVMKNLVQLTEEYCVDRQLNEDKTDASEMNGYRRRESLLRIENIMREYYMTMESLEFRMERHERLSKLAQKSIKLTLMEQENRRMAMKK